MFYIKTHTDKEFTKEEIKLKILNNIVQYLERNWDLVVKVKYEDGVCTINAEI